ncbi:miraculin-like [Magnolia sinica]|uniref:miraculin-like n=1 Tax=Magnolia sinica TaxID=86752 RepID=UPI002659AF91|nr:miraculin-like [Magnolia sinica]
MFRSSLVLASSLLAFFVWAPLTIVAHNPPVLDMQGNDLQSGMDYHVMVATLGSGGGGLSLTSQHNTSSPYVMQTRKDSDGKRLRFNPASSSMDGIIRQPLPRSWATAEGMIGENPSGKSVIRESSDLNIRFSSIPSVWKLGEPDELGMRYVMIGGKVGHPGRSTVNNWFKIEKVRYGKHTYKMMYCPSVCGSCKTACGELGISYQNGTRYLTLSSNHDHPLVDNHYPLVVMFMREENH